mmetsp:Transcript_116560/g.370721  ORF Transcript_116560/g.370721 Transcript_116560/m.370721 type:complete len:230 (+) Transcript_116560:4719-5408(+)
MRVLAEISSTSAPPDEPPDPRAAARAAAVALRSTSTDCESSLLRSRSASSCWVTTFSCRPCPPSGRPRRSRSASRSAAMARFCALSESTLLLSSCTSSRASAPSPLRAPPEAAWSRRSSFSCSTLRLSSSRRRARSLKADASACSCTHRASAAAMPKDVVLPPPPPPPYGAGDNDWPKPGLCDLVNVRPPSMGEDAGSREDARCALALASSAVRSRMRASTCSRCCRSR